jgi:hypothetical protein
MSDWVRDAGTLLAPAVTAALMVVSLGCTKLPEAFSSLASPRPSTRAVDSTLTPT